MAATPKSDTPRKSETVTFRIDTGTLNMIQRAARIRSKTVTSFVMEAAQAAAEQELLDQRHIRLDAEAFDEIEALLAEEPKVDAELVKLFQTDRQWID